jgi:phenylalanyl-tRNA synthetase beta chain
LTREIDLIEDIARIHGYEAIPEDRAVPQVPSSRTRRDRVLGKLRTLLVGSGYYEALTLSAVDDQSNEAFSPWSDAPSLQAATPVLRRANNLRRSLVPSLLTARRTNETLANPRIELFETAKVYWSQAEGLPQEEWMLGLCSGGDFFAVKGIINGMLDLLRPGMTMQLKPFNHPLLASGRSAELWLDDERLGFLGEVSKAGQVQFELRGPATVAELRITPFDEIADLIPIAKNLSAFPSVARDINLVVDEQIRWADVEQTIRSSAGPLLEQLEYQETYRDNQRLGAGKKSLLFSLMLRDNATTLTSGAADSVRDSVVAACSKAHGGTLRT